RSRRAWTACAAASARRTSSTAACATRCCWRFTPTAGSARRSRSANCRLQIADCRLEDRNPFQFAISNPQSAIPFVPEPQETPMPTAQPSSAEVIDLFKRYVIGNYTRYPVCLVRGEGSYVWDAEGNRYLDFFPGWGCNLLGHCPPRVVEAVRDQVGKLIHVPNTWYTEPQGELAPALVERCGFDGRAFFCNSRTEA